MMFYFCICLSVDISFSVIMQRHDVSAISKAAGV